MVGAVCGTPTPNPPQRQRHNTTTQSHCPPASFRLLPPSVCPRPVLLPPKGCSPSGAHAHLTVARGTRIVLFQQQNPCPLRHLRICLQPAGVPSCSPNRRGAVPVMPVVRFSVECCP